MKKRVFFIVAFSILSMQYIYSQSTTDAYMMKKGLFCNLINYNYTYFNKYWEGNLLRNNENLGKVESHTLSYMFNYGLTNKLNVMATINYSSNSASVAYLDNQKGFQDVGLFIKYNPYTKFVKNGFFDFFAIVGASIPTQKYNVEIQPLSLGLGSKNVYGEAIANFTHKTGLYATAVCGFTYKSDVELYKDAIIYKDKYYYTNMAPVQNTLDYSISAGYTQDDFRAVLKFEQSFGLDGDDIRYNEAPQVTNQMEYQKIGVFSKYYFNNRLAVEGETQYTLNGRNIGKSISYNLGISYVIGKF